MSDTTARVKLIVDTGDTLKTANKEAEQLQATMARIAKSMKNLGTPRPVAAARKAAATDEGALAGKESGTARGVGGLTGAAGRDFAKQAEGLGGLVRVYATFAANIFAATAAFGALSRAADTTNLVKGLDQLGAASGRNLGALGKQLVIATDGALSLRDALAATAQASAAGMNTKDILRMGEVAKNASIALGRDLPDAVNRLTRGITKLEPELLDEIGIMVRVDTAVSNYAKSIGKSSLSLTEFERRQAFANAVLEQGEKKFGNIKLDTNPYSKILASFQNLMQVGLELVNKVLSPVLELLSSSPAALGLAMAGIASTLLRQAIPALSGWKAGLDTSAEAARNAVIEANKLRKVRAEDRAEAVDKISREATKNAQTALDKLSTSTKTHAAIKKAASIDAAKASDLEIAALRRELAESERVMAAKRAAGASELTIQRYEAEQSLARQALSSLDIRAKAEKEIQAILDETAKKSKKNVAERIRDYWTLDAAAQRNADKAVARSQRTDIINSAVNNAATNSYITTLKDMYAAIGKARIGQDAMGVAFIDGQKKMGVFNAGLTALKGTVLVTASAVSTLAASLGNLFAIIGIATVVFNVLDSFLSTSVKQQKKFLASLDDMESSLDSLSRTIDFINNKDPINVISIESSQASATAIDDISSSIDKTTASFGKLLEVRDKWDNFWDSLWDFVGKGSADKLSTSLAATIVETFKAMEDGPAKEAGRKAIQSITNVENLSSFKELNAQLRKLDDSQAYEAATAIASALKDMSKVATESSANLVSFKASLEEVTKQNQIMINSLKATDEFSKLGTVTLQAGKDLKKAFSDPMDALKALKTLASSTATLSLLPEDSGIKLGTYRKELENISAQLVKSKTAAKAAREEFNSLNTPRRRTVADVINKDRAENAASRLEAEVDVYTEKLNEAINKFKNVGNELFSVGIQNLTKGMNNAMAQAGIELSKSYLSAIKTAGGDTSKLETDLRNKELDLQAASIEAMYLQSKRMLDLTITLERSNTLAERNVLKDQIDNMDAREVGRRELLDRLAKLDASILTLSKQKSIVSMSDREAMKVAKDPNNALYEAAKGLEGFFAELFGKNSKLAQVMSAKLANILEGDLKKSKFGIDEVKSGVSKFSDANKLSQQEVDSQQGLLGIYDEQLAKKKQALQVQALNLEYAGKMLDLLEQETATNIIIDNITRNGQANTKAGEEQIQKAREAGDKAREQRFVLAGQLNTALNNQQLDFIAQDSKASNDKMVRDNQIFESAQQNANTLSNIVLDGLQQELDYKGQLGTLNDTDRVLSTYKMSIAKEQVDYANKLLGLKSAEIAQEILLEDIKRKASAGLPVTELVQQYTQQSQLLQQQLDIINSTNKAKLTSIENTKNVGLEQIRAGKALKDQEESMSRLMGVTKSLAAVFGEVGDRVSGVVTAISEMTVAYQDSGNKQKVIQDQLAKDRLKFAVKAGDSTEEEERKAKEIAKIENKATHDITQTKLEGYLAITSVAKKAFKEQSRGAETIAKIERAIHIAKLAMWAKEMVAQATTVATTVASESTKAAASGTSAIAAAFAAPWPVGFVAGAAMIAIITSLLGGKGSKVSTGFSAGAQQEVQGTGQRYDENGELVNRSGGALGDPTAKADSLNKGIETIEKHSFKTMEYSNDMLDNLKAIKKNTEGLSGILLEAGLNVKGVISPDGTTKFGTFQGTTDMGFELQAADKLLGKVFGESSGIAEFASKITSKIAGGRVKVELQDIGIQIEGSLNQIISGSKDIASIYENVLTTKDGGWFRSDKTTSSTNIKDLTQDPELKILGEGISNVFGGIKDTVLSAADALGKDSETSKALADTLNIQFKASFKGLEPDELTKALEAEFSVAFNQLAETVLPELQKFRKPAEEFGDTIIRLARNVQVSSLALEAAALSIGDIKPTIITTVEQGGAGQTLTTASESVQMATVRITESLIGLSGGLDAFVEKTNFYADNFLTETEKLAPVQKRVTEELARLQTVADKAGLSVNIASVNSRKGFADIVKSLNLTTDSGQELFAGMMSVAEGFAEVYEETRKTSSILKELLAENAKLADQYDKLTLSTTDYNAKITADLSPTDKTAYNTAFTENQLLLDKIASVEENNKLTYMSIEILKAQGKNEEALKLQREAELSKLGPLQAAIRRQVHLVEDQIKAYQEENKLRTTIANQDIELLRAQGKESEALALSRTRELEAILPANRALQEAIYSRQDEIAAIVETARISKARTEEEINILNALGHSYTATIYSRKLALEGLSEEEAALRKYLHAVEDTMNTSLLEIELMEAQGSASEALASRRRLELRGLSAVDQQLKVHIWRLQDEAALRSTYNSQQIRIMELLGNSQGALALSRKAELEALDPQLRVNQEYIYALEDQEDIKQKLIQAYDREKSSIQDTVKALRDSSRALKEYRDGLLLSDKSVLSPRDKYAEAKQQALDLSAIASGPAVTEAQIEARDRAVSKLPAATDAWLEASRTLYASSEAYTNDFSLALSILDSVSGAMDAQMTDAEKQLSALDSSNTFLESITESQKTSVQLMQELLAASNLANELAKSVTSTPPTAAAIGPIATLGRGGTLGSADTTWKGTNGYSGSSKDIQDTVNTMVHSDPYGLYNKFVSEGFTSSMMDKIMGYENGTALRWALDMGLPAFAKGGLASGLSLVGEKGPELVDFSSPGQVYSNSNTTAMLGNTAELVNEIKALRAEVAKLREEQREQTGHLIQSNYDANGKAAEKIAAANDGSVEVWRLRNQVKLA